MRAETTLPREVSSAELAALFNVTTKTVSLWARDGIAVRTRYGRFDLAQSVQAFARHHREAAKHTTPGLETGPEARARLARLRADIAEQAYKREKGEFVDAGEFIRKYQEGMKRYWREVRQIPWVIAGTLSFVDREMATLIERELHRCHSNVGLGRGPDEDGPGTDYDDVAEHSLMTHQGRLSTVDGQRIANEARARRAAASQ
jgi:phage terminase Nu1 subunit (DNA packaging protein)